MANRTKTGKKLDMVRAHVMTALAGAQQDEIWRREAYEVVASQTGRGIMEMRKARKQAWDLSRGRVRALTELAGMITPLQLKEQYAQLEGNRTGELEEEARQERITMRHAGLRARQQAGEGIDPHEFCTGPCSH